MKKRIFYFFTLLIFTLSFSLSIINPNIAYAAKKKNSNLKQAEKPQNESIHFIKVPVKGDATVLESNGKYAMIDLGNKGDTLNETNTVLNYLKKKDIKELEFVLFTHLHCDHIGGKIYVGVQNKNSVLNTLVTGGIKIKKIYCKNYTPSLPYHDVFENIADYCKFYGIKMGLTGGNSYRFSIVNETQVKEIKLEDLTIYLFNRANIHTKYGSNNTSSGMSQLENCNSITCLIIGTQFNAYIPGDLACFNSKADYNIHDPEIVRNTVDTVIAKLNSLGKNLTIIKTGHHGGSSKFNPLTEMKKLYDKRGSTPILFIMTNPTVDTWNTPLIKDLVNEGKTEFLVYNASRDEDEKRDGILDGALVFNNI